MFKKPSAPQIDGMALDPCTDRTRQWYTESLFQESVHELFLSNRRKFALLNDAAFARKLDAVFDTSRQFFYRQIECAPGARKRMILKQYGFTLLEVELRPPTLLYMSGNLELALLV